MAAAAAYRRWGQLGTNSGISRLRGFGASDLVSSLDRAIYDSSNICLSNSVSVSLNRQLHCRHISQIVQSNGKRLFLVDTLALVITLHLFLCFWLY
jgi:hypothetical protein